MSVVSGLAQCMCAPFWWSVATPEDAVDQILHNGTICYIDTSSRRIGITANHVYKKYLADKEAHDAEAIECQFGSSTIYPERRVIDASEKWDIATLISPTCSSAHPFEIASHITTRSDGRHIAPRSQMT